MAEKWIRRKGTKKSGFRYSSPTGSPVRDTGTLERIDLLRIPPAWTDVHIAASSRAAIQVWGLDARGRKQYRYHRRAVEKGALRKYYRVRQMAKELPLIRKRLWKDLRRKDNSRDRICAGVVLLISHAWFRVGSEKYQKENNSFGITTLRKSHVASEGDRIVFTYRGKRGMNQRQSVTHEALVEFVENLMKTPGHRLFRYQEGKRWVNLDSREVNDYIGEVAGVPYTAKDFRTWGGSLRAATILSDIGHAPRKARAKNVLTTVRLVSSELGNTPVICKKSYVHPLILTQYLKSGATITLPSQKRKSQDSNVRHTPEEVALLEFLDKHFPERRTERRTNEG